MTACKVMVKAPVAKVKSQFQEYEDMEFSKRGYWTLVEDFSGTQLFGWEVLKLSLELMRKFFRMHSCLQILLMKILRERNRN